MAKQHVFQASIDERGRVHLDEKPKWDEAGRSLAAKGIKRAEVVLRRPKSKRSIEMNKYLHCETGPFQLMAEYMGDSIEDAKYALMGACFGWKFCKLAGREIPVKAHSSDMTIEESQYFVDWVIPWAAQNHGVLIQLPNEAL